MLQINEFDTGSIFTPVFNDDSLNMGKEGVNISEIRIQFCKGMF